MSTFSTATVMSSLFGDRKGTEFNDLETVIGTYNTTINTAMPIKEIKLMYGGVIDGIQITYNQTVQGAGTQTVRHGTSPDTTPQNAVLRATIQIAANESIVAISGRAGPSLWGNRIVQLNFAIYNSSTGNMRVEGPFGGNDGTPFRVTANGNFISFSGYAINTDSSLEQLRLKKADGGLYGLAFTEVAYRSV